MSLLELIPGVQGYKELGELEGIEAAKGLYPATYQQSDLYRAAHAIQKAGERWKINPAYLWGIYGTETSFGRDLKTSKTGAKGPFQFEPATAKEYGYPTGVNEGGSGIKDWAAFEKQADAAAHYLYAHGGTSNIKGAVEAYNPGEKSYYSKVAKHASIFSKIFSANLANENVVTETESSKPSTTNPLKGIEALGNLANVMAEWLSDPMRVGKLIGGAVLVYMGIRSLTRTGAGVTVTQEVQHQASAAAAPIRAMPVAKVARKFKKPTGGS